MFGQYPMFFMFFCVLSCHIIKTSPLPTAYSLVLLESIRFLSSHIKFLNYEETCCFQKHKVNVH